MTTTRRSFISKSGLTIASFGLLPQLLDQKGLLKVEKQILSLTANVKPLADEEYLQRIEKARRTMHANGIDALFITGETDLQYFTKVNWWQSERLFGVLLPQKGDPVWVCPAFELPRAKERVKTGSEIRTWEEHENPNHLISGIMKDFGLGNGTLGIAPTVRSFVYFGIQNEFKGRGIQLVDGSVVTQSCRAVKTSSELDYMDLANNITKLAYKEAFKSFHENMSAEELAENVSNAHSRLGASNGGGWPQFGPNTAFPHGSNVRRTLQDGDVVMIDGGCSVEGYSSDVTRTVIYGSPSSKQKQVFEIVLNAQKAAFNSIKPGVSCESIDMAARKVIEDAGYGPGYKYFAHRIGHGIGMQGHEYPYLVGGNKLLLEPGMTFSNEPGIYIYGEFGIRTEDCFVVTEEGARWLGGMIAESLEKPFGEI
jgi:Xaa-Pro dipeptidase